MKVLHVCSELYPLLKTGGLADVLGALPLAQKNIGVDARVLIPAFPKILAGIPNTVVVREFDYFWEHAVLRYGEFNGVGIYLIDCPNLYNRDGNPYHDMWYQDYQDNYKRFAMLGWVASEMTFGMDDYWTPDVIHAHDWHAGLAPAYLRAKGSHAKSVCTVHNLAYQGLFSPHHLSELDLPHEFFNVNGLECYGALSYLKAGLYYADAITAVSPTYAKEITSPEFAYGLQGLLNTRNYEGRLVGILNGVDGNIWNPEVDSYIEDHYSVNDMANKAVNKRKLQQYFGLPEDPDALLFVIVTRLTEQKGLDLLVDAVGGILADRGQLAVLGSGAPHFEDHFRYLAHEHPDKIAVKIGYDEALSHLMVAGGDVILVPSRFEPCGLTQLYGLKYGTLPLVRATGGLADTVIPCRDETHDIATGFNFSEPSAHALYETIRYAFEIWKDKDLWATIQKNAMEQDFSWEVAAAHYRDLYSRL